MQYAGGIYPLDPGIRFAVGMHTQNLVVSIPDRTIRFSLHGRGLQDGSHSGSGVGGSLIWGPSRQSAPSGCKKRKRGLPETSATNSALASVRPTFVKLVCGSLTDCSESPYSQHGEGSERVTSHTFFLLQGERAGNV